jgi:hypothetical protein
MMVRKYRMGLIFNPLTQPYSENVEIFPRGD